MKIQSTDKAHVEVQVVVSLGIDGKVTATGQKILVNDTDGSQSNDGDPFDITLTDADQTNVNDALEAALTDAVTNAVAALPPAQSA